MKRVIALVALLAIPLSACSSTPTQVVIRETVVIQQAPDSARPTEPKPAVAVTRTLEAASNGNSSTQATGQ